MTLYAPSGARMETSGETLLLTLREKQARFAYDALNRLDDDEKNAVGLPDAMDRLQETLMVNEPGLYHLTYSSNKKSAQRFKRWNRKDVLPQIRKTGAYSIRPALPSPENLTRLEILKIATEMVSQLILFAYFNGLELALGGAYSTTGHSDNSLHYERLAIDLNLFKNGGLFS